MPLSASRPTLALNSGVNLGGFSWTYFGIVFGFIVNVLPGPVFGGPFHFLPLAHVKPPVNKWKRLDEVPSKR